MYRRAPATGGPHLQEAPMYENTNPWIKRARTENREGILYSKNLHIELVVPVIQRDRTISGDESRTWQHHLCPDIGYEVRKDARQRG